MKFELCAFKTKIQFYGCVSNWNKIASTAINGPYSIKNFDLNNAHQSICIVCMGDLASLEPSAMLLASAKIDIL